MVFNEGPLYHRDLSIRPLYNLSTIISTARFLTTLPSPTPLFPHPLHPSRHFSLSSLDIFSPESRKFVTSQTIIIARRFNEKVLFYAISL